jgi:hypothetical protein
MTDLAQDIMYSLQARLASLECKHHLQTSPAIGKGISPPAGIGAPFEGSTEHCLQRLKHLYDHLVLQNQPFRSVIIAHPFRDSSLMGFEFGLCFHAYASSDHVPAAPRVHLFVSSTLSVILPLVPSPESGMSEKTVFSTRLYNFLRERGERESV